MIRKSAFLYILFQFAFPAILLASEGVAEAVHTGLNGGLLGLIGLIIFILAYCLVPLENKIHLRKSKPVLLAAGVVWVLVAIAYKQIGESDLAYEAISHNLLEYSELLLFLLSAMTYINSLEERNAFESLRAYLVSRNFSLRQIFWITGLLAFVISPVADNLTTALLMGAVVMAVSRNNSKFVALACINVVVAANAGGAFSPFGDITTLMVWQQGKVQFGEFFRIFIPALVNWLLPALCMNFFIGREMPEKNGGEVKLKRGAYIIMILFLMTIITAVSFHNFLNLPPAAGMMLGLGYLGIYSYILKLQEGRVDWYDSILGTRRHEMMSLTFAFREKGKSLADIISTLDLPAFAINKEHMITHWNKKLEELTGISAQEVIGTRQQWRGFYTEERPGLANLVLDSFPDVLVDRFYNGKHGSNTGVEEGYDAVDFFPKIGEEGKWLHFTAAPVKDEKGAVCGAVEIFKDLTKVRKEVSHFDLMKRVSRAEWDTLFFFYGVILCVGGLSEFGYLAALSGHLYQGLGPTIANSFVGVLSAVVDNIPVMYAVLTMDPVMSHGQWLLVTLTTGVGGSMLSIGSAAGVALMGTARGKYTFGAHLKWTPVIILGYIASILCHLLISHSLM